MWSFLKKIFGFTCCVAVVVLCINALYMHKDETYKELIERYADMPNDIEVCIFGSSHEAGGLDVSVLSDEYTCFNFANGAQLPQYDVRLARCYEDRFSDEKGYMLIGLTYYSLRHMPIEEEETFEGFNKHNYWILENEFIIKYDRMADLYVTKLPSIAAGFDIFPVLFKRPLSDEEIEAMDYAWRYDCTNRQEVADSLENRYETFVNAQKGYLNRECVDAVYEMIDIARRHNMTPVLITAPVIKEVSEYIRKQSPGFFDMFYGDIEEICQNTGVSYFNYLEDERFVYDYSLFMDADHLNYPGGVKYTRVVAQEVLGIDIESDTD